MPSEVVKTRSITHRATVDLTEAEIAAYVIAGVKRDHKDLKDHDMMVEFSRLPGGEHGSYIRHGQWGTGGMSENTRSNEDA